jgi:hypothetical protein
MLLSYYAAKAWFFLYVARLSKQSESFLYAARLSKQSKSGMGGPSKLE